MSGDAGAPAPVDGAVDDASGCPVCGSELAELRRRIERLEEVVFDPHE